MAKIKIEVTQDDIDKGKPRDLCKCPIALAIRRGTGFKAYVGGISALLKVNKTSSLDGRMPRKCGNFVFDFDTGEPVKPFTFYLEY